MRLKVYIAGPYSQGDVAVNVRNAITAAHVLADAGFDPYVPHLTHFWHLLYPRTYAEWLALDAAWLRCCDVVLRLPGPSDGADGEVTLAQAWGLPVHMTIEALLESRTGARP